MSDGDKPLIRLEQGGSAPILSYNLPEPATYFGQNFIEFEYGDDVFTELAWVRPDEPVPEQPPDDEDDKSEQPPDDDDHDPDLPPPDDEDDKSEQPPDDDHDPDLPPPDDDGPGVPGPVQPIDPGGDEGIIRPQDSGGGAHQRARRRSSAHRQRLSVEELSDEELEREVRRSMRSGFADDDVLPNARVRSGKLRFSENSDLELETDLPVSEQVESLAVEEVVEKKKAGKELDFYSSMHGTINRRFIDRTREVRPAILLVETYRLASYRGSYGAGRVIKTFSLLPGERTTISIRTYRKTEEEHRQASSILDSFTEESSTDFERTIEQEQASKENYEKSFKYYSEAEAQAGWGWGKARVEGGVEGETNSAREEFAKNTSSATNKHAQKASAKREVQVDTSQETREVLEEEKTTEREIENINRSRTLNFVFRQMNQEFVTITSLVDVRVAFFNGFAESRDEFALPELDTLLERYIQEDDRDRVRADVLDALGNILDYEGSVHDDFVEERMIDADNRYHRVRSEKTSTYRDPTTGTEIEVPGVILSATKNSMRTDGVLVEALLGAGSALDRYSSKLQQLEVERGETELANARAAADRIDLENEAIRNNDEERVELLKRLSNAESLDTPLDITIQSSDGENDG